MLRRQKGFTLIELLITVAIMGILVALAVPAYTDYTNKARAMELMEAAIPYKKAVGIAIQVDGALTTGDYGAYDAGTNGLPANRSTTTTVHGVNILNGAITLTYQDDGSQLDAKTYILTPVARTNAEESVHFTATGTCVDEGWCE